MKKLLIILPSIFGVYIKSHSYSAILEIKEFKRNAYLLCNVVIYIQDPCQDQVIKTSIVLLAILNSFREWGFLNQRLIILSKKTIMNCLNLFFEASVVWRWHFQEILSTINISISVVKRCGIVLIGFINHLLFQRL